MLARLSRALFAHRRPYSIARSGVFYRRLSSTVCTEQPVSSASENCSTQSAATEAGRMLIGFTCNVCKTRTHRTMSRAAYTHGVVLAECPGCASRHLIADNLGWFGARKAASPERPEGASVYEPLNVETMAQDAGEAVRRDLSSEAERAAVLEFLQSSECPS